MNSVSNLAKELVTEYEAITGRKLTPSEYLDFRKQALKEINMGFGNYEDSMLPKHIVSDQTGCIKPAKIAEPNKTVQIVHKQANERECSDNESTQSNSLFDVIDSLEA